VIERIDRTSPRPVLVPVRQVKVLR